MKSRNLKSILIAVCLAFVLPLSGSLAQAVHQDVNEQALQENQQGGPEFENEKIGAAYRDYLYINAALVDSHAGEAQTGAKMLAASLKEVENARDAQKYAEKIAGTTALEEQREAFITLSESMTELVKGSISSGELYKAYCPMANDNKGASWLTSEKTIKNPYFGEQMLNCGSVKETIQK